MTKTAAAGKFQLTTIIATWFWSGLSPRAPGTAGSLAALPFGIGIFWLGGPNALAIAIPIIFVIGTWATNVYLVETGKSDPGEVVVDEVAGQWVPLLIAGMNPVLWAASFLFFRLFDIWKPWPIRWMDRSLKGAFGVMADDMVAGLFAAVCVYILKQVMG
ncbi:phosphatidylglycerophosphatase A family protein [Sneathiella chinensis]|uniref:Phosphatidylglycerophosphatase A n=1 Tax=Sneathiella chinensis TaxID=349750 RepID=A0ABQ5U6D1_9PROT|nr:phosphatidylglycerophosphatase A [Sneathiella chinensis]GLQ07243.1 phosphatidylglycerophosphatase A [Sneathiella chinensis]